jgi:hypothetical protein
VEQPRRKWVVPLRKWVATSRCDQH